MLCWSLNTLVSLTKQPYRPRRLLADRRETRDFPSLPTRNHRGNVDSRFRSNNPGLLETEP
jgi:hypothetical protein